MPRKRFLEGIEKTNRVFRTLSRESRERITDAMNRGLAEMVRDARRLVPVDNGDLKRTVRSTGIRVREDGRAIVGYVIAGDTKQTAEAAYRSEFGRKPGGHGKIDMSRHPGHPPEEFMFPAYWRNRNRARGRIKRAINAAAKEAARSGR